MNKKELFFMRDFIEILKDSELRNVVGGYTDWEINLPEALVLCDGHDKGYGTCWKCYCVHDYELGYRTWIGKPEHTGFMDDYCGYHGEECYV